MTIIEEEEPDLERRRSDWALDEWDEPEIVPVVEPLRQQTRLLKWVVWLSLVLVAGMIIVAGYVGWWYLGQTTPPGDGGEAVAFNVTETDTLDSLTDRLVEEGFVVDGSVFKWYVEKQGGLEITPGFYQIPTASHMGNVLARLRTPPEETYFRVTFPEGFTVEQMAERLAESSPRLDANAFLEIATNGEIPSPFVRPPGVDTLEGLLFPDTYQVSNADNEGQVIDRMIKITERVADQEDLEAKAAELERTPYEILIVASMIEKEAKLAEDRPKIARVIYNRLFISKELEIDAAVRYGAPDSIPFDQFSRMRQTPGPYNTYQNKGLPPTPIASPGRASIRAALNPAVNPPPGDPICQVLPDPTKGCLYLYYVLADEQGGHAFAVTGEQHQENVNRAAELGLLDG